MHRTRFIDPDYRRSPKTLFFCARCQKDLAADQAHRFIAYELDDPCAIHSEDWEIAKADIAARRIQGAAAFCVEPVGMDCARRIGLEYTRTRQ